MERAKPQYVRLENDVIGELDRIRILEDIGYRTLAKWTNLSFTAVIRALRGDPVQTETASRLRRVAATGKPLTMEYAPPLTLKQKIPSPREIAARLDLIQKQYEAIQKQLNRFENALDKLVALHGIQPGGVSLPHTYKEEL